MKLLAILACFPCAAATYVGNASCKPCHTKIYNDYSATPMARSSGRVIAVPPGVTSEFVKKLGWFIGSGAAGKSFVHAVEGHLFQAPLTWYSQRGIWDISPGYTDANRWNRPIDSKCFYCHASQPRAIYGTENKFANPPFTQDGVGCERCHGPGSEHAAGKARLVNPAKLTPARRDAVCAQCHLSGEARIERAGRSLSAYRPGDELHGFVSYFVYEGQNLRDIKATGYVERLAVSKCKIESGDKLWCGSCHDPHSLPEPAKAAAFYRDRCRTCHAVADCDRGSDCRMCHMPRGKAVDGGHGVLTDHGIPRRMDPAGAHAPGWRLQPFLSPAATDRDLGLAYAEVSLRTNHPLQQADAVRRLSNAAPDGEVLARLADLLAREGKRTAASELYRRAIALGYSQTFALVNSGALEAEVGNHERAISLWRQALKSNPGLTEASVNLATLLEANGRKQEAEAVRARARAIERGQAVAPAPTGN